MENNSSNIDKLLEEGNKVSIVDQFRHIVQQYSEHIAVEEGKQLTSYQELDKLSDSIAFNLINHGVIGGDQVAVSLPRSLLLTATLLAILKCGACYVPLDPTAPITRRRRVLSLSNARCIVTGADHVDDYRQVNVRTFQVESLIEHVDQRADEDLPANSNPLACIFFTSGSTGEPKGVLVEQRGVLNVACQPAYVPLAAGDRMANFANPTFDALTFEVWGALLNGATLVVFSQAELTDTDRLAGKIESSCLDVAFITTSLFNLLVEIKVPQVTKIKHVLVGGEAFTPQSAKAYYQACQRIDGQLTSQLYNGYGPTECTTFSACYPLDSELVDHYIKVGRVPIGQSIKGTQVIVVAGQDRLAKTDEQGEIYISGAGLAQGYNKDTGLTKDKFVCLAWLDPSKRWYRTGDLALINGNKQVEYLGRADQQVKIRGHRIETSEIDNQLLSHPGVTQAVTLAVDQENNSADLHSYLVSDLTLTKPEIRRHVRSQLPDYMTPHRFFYVTHIPLNANGKLDRKALSLMESEELLSAPMSVVEKEILIQQCAPDRGLAIANDCAAILGIRTPPPLDQTFIESGGDSLRAMRLASCLKSQYSLSVTVGDILQPISLLELIVLLEAKPKITLRLTEEANDTPARYLASPEQQRLAFLYHLDPLSSAYNSPFFFYLDQALEYTALQKAWCHLVERHATLRSCFELENGETFAVIREMNRESVKISQKQIKKADLSAELNAFSCQTFDIERESLARVCLFSLQGENTQVLAMSLHHLIIDGWSLNVLLEELSQLYLAQVTDEQSALPELRNTYQNFCAFSRKYRQSDEYLVQHEYWQRRIANVADSAPLFAQSGALSKSGAIETSQIDPLQWQAIKATVKREGVTLFSFTLAAYSLLLGQYFQRDFISVGSPVANRGTGDFEQIIGMFVNTSVFHMDVKPTMAVDQYIQAVHRHVVETQQNQDIDFEDIVSMLPQRASINPLFDCMLVLENTDLSRLTFPQTNIKAESGFNGEAKFPITLFITEHNGSASLCLEYNTSLLNSQVAGRFLSRFQSNLLSFTDDFSTPLGQLNNSPQESHFHSGLLASHSSNQVTKDLDLKYWRNKLSGVNDFHYIRTDHSRKLDSGRSLVSSPQVLARETTSRLRQLAGKQETSIFTLLSGIFSLLAYRWSGRSDISISAALFNQQDNQSKETPTGFVVLRNTFKEAQGFTDTLMCMAQTQCDAYRHNGLTFEQIINVSEVTEGIGHKPGVQLCFTLDNQEANSSAREVVIAVGEPHCPAYDIGLHIVDWGDDLKATWTYADQLFSPTTIAALQDSFHAIIDAVLADPSKDISRIPLVSGEMQARIKCWNDTQVDYPKELTFPDLFEAQVKRTPAATACVWLGDDNRQHQLTYQELNIRANKLAHKLIDLGAGPGDIVGLAGAWTLNTVLGILAILKAGAAYLPLDSRNPIERLKNIIQETGADILLGCGAIDESLEGGVDKLLLLNDLLFWESIASQPGHDPIRQRQSFGPSDLAFMIFTSGSTGQPKGVMVEHRNISNLLFSLQDMLQVSAQDTIPSITSPGFDIHVTEIYLPLVCGAKVAILDWEQVHTPAKLAACQKHLGISIMQATPASWQMLTDFGWRPTDHLKMITGGDHLTNQLRDSLLSGVNESRLFNIYGPSEATVYCSGAEIKLDTDRIHIGRPLANNRLYILDAHKNMAPIGVVGELYIAGANVTRGYLDNLELTNEKYSVDPFAINDERMYQSGDLARWLPDGTVELIGRKDFQIKINGFRIELGEIESCLCQHKRVEQSIVTTHKAAHGEELLIAYVKSKQGNKQLSLELSEMAKAALPAYMTPALFICVDTFPVTNNGKIDRAALPPPDFAAQSKGISKAGGDLAADLLNVDTISTIINTAFTSVLGYSIDLEKSFFEAGANSLLLMKVHSQLIKDNRLKHKGQTLALVDLFNYPSISRLAQHLQVNSPCSNPKVAINQHAQHKAPMQPSCQDEIAVIGMAVRLPGADNLAEFWQAIESGKECIETLGSSAHQDDNWVGVLSSMSGLADFDPGYFGLSDQEARLMDPQQRHGLMSAVHALENAGISPDLSDQKIGVVMCASDNSYQQRIIERACKDDSPDRYQLSLLNEKDHLATRLAYHLNLKGPAITVQSACSSSLVAIHQACQQLRSGDSGVCLAGGTNADLELLEGYRYRQGMILSRDGHCKPFSQDASGTVPANGVGIVVLKPLANAKADGDRIYAVIRGSAINNDGNDKVSYFAPSVQGQIDVLKQAQRNAGVTSEQISYVEAHGTGTELGDPMEVKALTDAFAENRNQQQISGVCALGSVKSQMGHLGSAAGVTGFIRTALSLYHAVLPPTLWAATPNINIDFSKAGFHLNSESRQWKGTTRLAGVSSFGMGGTNAHAILSSMPEGYCPASKAPAWDAANFAFNCQPYLSKWHCDQNGLDSGEALPEEVSSGQLPQSQWLMQEQWVRAYRIQSHPVNPKQFLVIDDIHKRGESVTAGLRARGYQVKYIDSISSAIEQLATLPLSNRPLTIVNMTLDAQGSEGEPNSLGSSGCLLSIVTLLQVWEQRAQRQPLSLINLVSGSADVLGEETLNPNAGLLLGLAQTIPLELERIEYRVLDMLPTLSSERLVCAIEGLEQNSADEAYHFAVRGRYVWRKEYQPLPQHFLPSKPLVSNGVYLITGGTGGIGKAIAEHLQATRETTVILLSRTATGTHLHPEKSIQQLRCDVSKREDMAYVADQVMGQFGKVTGIIHAAGSAGGGMIRLLEPGTATANMAAKVLGAINIDAELLMLEPEFIAYCSSMSVVHGVAGQTDYCAANHFLDLYAKAQNQRIGGPQFISINWPTWRGTGMAEQVEQTDFAISPDQGVALLDTLVSGGDAQYLISPLDHQNAKRFFATLHAGHSKMADSMKINSQDISPLAYISSLFADILGFDEIDEDECFYDLGGDSLTVLDLFDGINARFPNKVRLADLAQNVTIFRLAEELSTSSETDVLSHLEQGIITCLKEGDSSLGCDIVIHPIGGDLTGYREWVDVMPAGRAIYGIRDPLLLSSGSQTRMNTVEVMAEHYAGLIQSYQPARIIGWSFGAFVAWQMTRMLEKQGKSVSLVMIDPPTLSGVQSPNPTLDNKVFIDEITQQYPHLKGKLNPQSTPEEIANTLYPRSKQQAQQVERSQAQWYIERVITACRKNAAAISAFRPQGKVSTNTLLCIATQHIDDESVSVEASWQPYLGQIQYHAISADHYSILQGSGAKHIMRLMSLKVNEVCVEV